MGWTIVLMLVILQWNARSLVANGLEFKGYVNKMEVKPDVICVQESWLKPKLDFVIKGFVSVRRDREEGNGGGCVTFIKSEIQCRMVGKGREIEYVVVEVWKDDKSVVIINYYNPCRQMILEEMVKIEG
jgi:exonuclease III